MINTATIFQTDAGASGALGFIRDLPATTVANFLLTDSGDTTISDTQVVKDIDFPAKGDESYAWRISGKATFADGFTVILIADTVFVRTGRVNANITAVGHHPWDNNLPFRVLALDVFNAINEIGTVT